MDITNELKYRFCKNCGIPINLYIEPYFTDRIKLLEKQYGSASKYQKFLESIEGFKSEQEYYEFYNNVKDTIIAAIKATTGYQRFNEMDMKEIGEIIKRYSLPSKTIYKPTFSGKRFISIDMKQANFTSMHYYDPAIFDGATTWEEYIRKFTDDECIIESKYVRQRIFGECNPNRQTTYEKFLMCGIVAFLLARLPKENVVSFSKDEIVILDNENKYLGVVNECVSKYMRTTGLKVKVETFTLVEIGKDLGYIKKYHSDGHFKLKCVSSEYIPMLLRCLQNGVVMEDDLRFSYKGTTARFDKVPNQILLTRLIQNDFTLAKKCKCCGKIIPASSFGSLCKGCAIRVIEENDKKKFEAAIKVKLKDANPKRCVLMYSDTFEKNDGYFSDIEELEEYCEEHSIEMPKYVYGTTPYSISMNAEDIIEEACDNLHEDAMSCITDNDIEELQKYLNEWCRNQTGTTTYEVDYSYAILLKGEE